jgi:glycosyltransferase involved in cell wall biosynthesis
MTLTSQGRALPPIELVTHNPPGTVSGIGRYVRELYRVLQPRLTHVRLTPDVPPPFTRRFVALRHFPVGIQEHQPGAIVHFTQIMGCAMMLYKPFRPAVATVHDLGVLVCREDEALFDRIGRAIVNAQFMGLKRMDWYAVNSEQTRRHLVEKLGVREDRIAFVQLGVELETFRPIPDARAQIAERYGLHPLADGFDLIYTGSELPRKNVGQLLEAMAILKRRGYRLRLIKVGGAGGDKWRAQTLAAVDRLGLRDDVHFAGVVPEDDLPLFYSAADLAVQPTLLEGGFAWMVMEAMACGTPAVASEASHIPEDAREAVIVVETRSLSALTEGIARALDDPAGRAARAAAGQRIIQKYTWEATADAMIRVYENAAAHA